MRSVGGAAGFEPEARGHQPLVAGDPVPLGRRREGGQAIRPGTICRRFDLQQQRSQLLSPGVFEALLDERRLAQLVGIAAGMLTLIVLPIRPESIVDHPPRPAGNTPRASNASRPRVGGVAYQVSHWVLATCSQAVFPFSRSSTSLYGPVPMGRSL